MRDPLWAGARRLLAWQAAVDRALPGELRGAVVVAGWRDGMLMLACGSGAAASRLRQLAPRLIKTLAEAGDVQDLRVRVVPHLQLARPVKAARRPLSDRALGELEQASQDLDDGPLRAALQRMVRRHRKGPTQAG